MAMRWVETELRKTGDFYDKETADILAARLRHRGKDFQLPSSPEMPSAELQTQLEKVGYSAIYLLRGQSIRDLREAQRPIYRDWENGTGIPVPMQKVEVLPSIYSWVAINPKHFFLYDSDRKTLEQQQAMMQKYSAELQSQLGTDEVEAVIGGAADYTGVVFAHLDATNSRLLTGPEYTRTATSVEGLRGEPYRPVVGSFFNFPGHGLEVRRWSPDARDTRISVAPLVVPISRAR